MKCEQVIITPDGFIAVCMKDKSKAHSHTENLVTRDLNPGEAFTITEDETLHLVANAPEIPDDAIQVYVTNEGLKVDNKRFLMLGEVVRMGQDDSFNLVTETPESRKITILRARIIEQVNAIQALASLHPGNDEKAVKRLEYSCHALGNAIRDLDKEHEYRDLWLPPSP